MPTRLIPAARRTAVDDRPRLPGWVPPLPVAPPAPPGAARYIHTQASPAAVWTVNHNLGLPPTIKVYSTGSVEVLAAVAHVSPNQSSVTFNGPQSGFATCL